MTEDQRTAGLIIAKLQLLQCKRYRLATGAWQVGVIRRQDRCTVISNVR